LLTTPYPSLLDV
jgi:small subunit ribosomal protein S3Ae